VSRKQGHALSRKRLRALWNMGIQDVSPNEAEIARGKLADGGWNMYLSKDNPVGPAIMVDQRIFKKYEDYQDWHDQREGGSFCPGCEHSEYQHVAAQCYTCGYCGWSVSQKQWHRGI